MIRSGPTFALRTMCKGRLTMTLQLQLFASGLLAILLHESAHVLAAGLLGVKVKGCGISWRGVYIRRRGRDSDSKRRDFSCRPSGKPAVRGMYFPCVVAWEMRDLVRVCQPDFGCSQPFATAIDGRQTSSDPAAKCRDRQIQRGHARGYESRMNGHNLLSGPAA